jgi:hypothetical protein
VTWWPCGVPHCCFFYRGFLGKRTVSAINGDDVIFREPVQEFKHSPNQPLLCLLHDANEVVNYIAAGFRGADAGTKLTQIDIISLHPVGNQIRLRGLLANLDHRFKTEAEKALKTGSVFPLKPPTPSYVRWSGSFPSRKLSLMRPSQISPIQSATFPATSNSGFNSNKTRSSWG